MTAPPALALEIDEDKLTAYLLNLSHPVGGHKAKFFIAHGFDPNDSRELADALASQALLDWPGVVKPGYAGGVKHVLTGLILTPSGLRVTIVSIWALKPNETVARLVTAYPG